MKSSIDPSSNYAWDMKDSTLLLLQNSAPSTLLLCTYKRVLVLSLCAHYLSSSTVLLCLEQFNSGPQAMFISWINYEVNRNCSHQLPILYTSIHTHVCVCVFVWKQGGMRRDCESLFYELSQATSLNTSALSRLLNRRVLFVSNSKANWDLSLQTALNSLYIFHLSKSTTQSNFPLWNAKCLGHTYTRIQSCICLDKEMHSK